MTDLLWTHDSAAQLLKYAAPGARVEVRRVARGSDRARAYVVTVARLGHQPVSLADSYALPCPAAPLAKRVRDLAETAHRAA